MKKCEFRRWQKKTYREVVPKFTQQKDFIINDDIKYRMGLRRQCGGG